MLLFFPKGNVQVNCSMNFTLFCRDTRLLFVFTLLQFQMPLAIISMVIEIILWGHWEQIRRKRKWIDLLLKLWALKGDSSIWLKSDTPLCTFYCFLFFHRYDEPKAAWFHIQTEQLRSKVVKVEWQLKGIRSGKVCRDHNSNST